MAINRKYDVMVDGLFYHTIRYKTEFNIPPTEEELRKYVLSKLPTLRNRQFEVLESGKVNHGN